MEGKNKDNIEMERGLNILRNLHAMACFTLYP